MIQPKRKEDNRKEIEEKRKRIVDTYNLHCTNLSQVQKITEKREKAIDNFLKDFTEEQFIEICQKANVSSFLTGENDRKWKADFDFLMRTDKATSVLEGKYSEKQEQKGGNTNDRTGKYSKLDLSKNLAKSSGEIVDDRGLI